ncbi:protein kinase [Fragilaria crotonensis]|nr:protein kinase [Fragilaria crotonensis]
MGCGSSSATGRDHYKTLSPEPESLTPLFSGQDEQRIPRLDSFITTAPIESPNPSHSLPKNHSSDRPIPKRLAQAVKQQPPPTVPETDTFDDFDFPVSKNFDTSFTKKPPPRKAYHIDPLFNSDRRQEIEDDAISFPSLPDPPVSASYAHGETTSDNHPPPPTPPSESNFYNAPPTSLLAPLQVEQPKVKKEQSAKKKKKKRSKNKKASKADQDNDDPSSESGMRFEELYRLRGVLGKGAFSTVREGYHQSSDTLAYAVKCVNRKKLTEEDEAALLDEVAILKEMRHLHIIRLYDFFVEPSTYYLVMERMSGGELFDRIVAKAYYNEKEARDVCKILLEAVGFCHANSVAHRDLKPENLLLLSPDDDSAVKIADFGFAKKVYAPNSLTTQCGTPGYVSPEILEGLAYDTRADMWSVGVILYILLGGYPPFIENNQRDLFRKIRKGDYEFHEEYWGTVSAEAKDLISSLLTVDPNVRLSAREALENAWIRVDDEVLAQRDMGTTLSSLSKYNAKRKFKAAVSTVMAVNKLQSLGSDFVKNLS